MANFSVSEDIADPTCANSFAQLTVILSSVAFDMKENDSLVEALCDE